MKKGLLLILVLALLFAFTAPSLAATIETSGTTGTTDVTYTATQSFTVTIPDSVTLDKNNSTTQNVSLEAGHVLPLGSTLSFAITAATNYENNKWQVIGASGKKLEYTIKDGENPIAKDAAVTLKETTADTADSNKIDKALAFAFAEGVAPFIAEAYTDQLTFTVTLTPAP